MRYLACGYKVIAITDHADYSNIETVIKGILEFTRHWPKNAKIKVLPGIELTHIPPEQFKPLAKYARKKGMKIIVGHGESPVEPVIKGSNRAALKADIDILAHPGLISDADIKVAKKKGIFLEITSRRGHRKTNAYVAKRALKLGADLILSTDSHAPKDIITPLALKNFGKKAGISENNLLSIHKKLTKFLQRKGVII